MSNFLEVLNTRVSDISRPPLIPVGTYIARVKAIPSTETIGNGKWDVLDFQLQLVSPMEDVDQEALAEYGGLSGASVLRHRFMFSKEDETSAKRSLYNLKRFLLDHLQMPGTEETSMRELLNDCVGQTCSVFVRWRPDQNDPEIQYNEVGKTAPAV